MIAFFDASALIYLIEASEPFASKVRSKLATLTRHYSKPQSAISRLTWLECRVRPMRRNEHQTLALFDLFFARPDLIWVELSKDVVELATTIRARYGTRTSDALQAACCLQLGPDHLFLTGDDGFAQIAGLNVRSLK